MKQIALLLAFATLPAFASFKITKIAQTPDSVSINFTTEEMFESICRLNVDSITLTSPDSALEQGLTKERVGVIQVLVSERQGRCFRTSGVHSGSILLDKGENLPRLQTGGTYELRINGEHLKDLVIE